MTEKLKINLGCGDHKLEGWVNVDRSKSVDPSKKGDYRWDVLTPCPFENGSAAFIFSEHFWEHLTLQEGFNVAQTCHQILNLGGIMRIAVPGFAAILEAYNSGEWVTRPQMKYEFPIKTGAVYVNSAFRMWNHRFIYDSETLITLMKKAGFREVYEVEHRQSQYPELKGLEHRSPKYSNLIVEALK